MYDTLSTLSHEFITRVPDHPAISALIENSVDEDSDNKGRGEKETVR